MNRIARTIATALTATVCAGVTLVGAPAQAASSPHRESTARVSGKHCTDRGVSNYYVHHWDPVFPWKILHSGFTFQDHKCKVNGFRLYKSSADTYKELKFMRHFLATDRPKKPTVFCRTTKHHAYFLDLAGYWRLFGLDHPFNKAERQHYTGWAHDYADRHGCRTFEPKAG